MEGCRSRQPELVEQVESMMTELEHMSVLWAEQWHIALLELQVLCPLCSSSSAPTLNLPCCCSHSRSKLLLMCHSQVLTPYLSASVLTIASASSAIFTMHVWWVASVPPVYQCNLWIAEHFKRVPAGCWLQAEIGRRVPSLQEEVKRVKNQEGLDVARQKRVIRDR